MSCGVVSMSRPTVMTVVSGPLPFTLNIKHSQQTQPFHLCNILQYLAVSCTPVEDIL